MQEEARPWVIARVGQNRTYTVFDQILDKSLPKLPYTHCMNIVLANLTYVTVYSIISLPKYRMPTPDNFGQLKL
jgi:hypothetical protein